MANVPLVRQRPGAAVLNWLGRYYSVFVVLAAWELLAHSGWVNARLFPSLETIGQASASRPSSASWWAS
jgi:ABC-type nitrate/sulfonate/bicarbonate transport system permease component